MKYHEYGDKSLPVMMLIHGGGWSYWMYLQEARLLQDKYHVILPVLDGHGEEKDQVYISTEHCAKSLIAYVEEHHEGKLFLLGGVSLGGQIAIEMMAQKPELAKYVIIESGMCIPSKRLLSFTHWVNKWFGKYIYSEKFNRWAVKKVPMAEELVPMYIRDMSSIRMETLNAFVTSYYAYTLKEALKQSNAKFVYWYGTKELSIVRECGEALKGWVQHCEVVPLKGYNHGEISTYHPEEWVALAEDFLNEQPIRDRS